MTEMLNKMDFVIMPVLNVDGYVFTWNKVQVMARNQFILTLSLPERMMEVCKVTLTFESVDQILCSAVASMRPTEALASVKF